MIKMSFDGCQYHCLKRQGNVYYILEKKYALKRGKRFSFEHNFFKFLGSYDTIISPS